MMTPKQNRLNPGLTAIAAVLALSSTPLLAQVADPAASQPTTTVPPPAPTPDPVTATPSDPLSPAPAPATDATTSVPATSGSTATTPTRSSATRATTAHRSVRARTASTRTTAPARAATPVAAHSPVHAPAPVKAASTPAPAPVPAPPPAVAAPAPAAFAPAPAPTPAPAPAGIDSTETAELAGAGLLALLLLGGGAAAMRRRRRRREEEEDRGYVLAAEPEYEPAPPAIAPVAEPVAEPRFARPEPALDLTEAVPAAGLAAAAAGDRPAMGWDRSPQPVAPAGGMSEADRREAMARLPEGFDLSRFGPHVQQAYLGPTEDNPSLSLKARLRKAAALDKRARETGEQPPASTPAPAAAPTRATAPAPAGTVKAHAPDLADRAAQPQRQPQPALFAGGVGSLNGWARKPAPQAG